MILNTKHFVLLCHLVILHKLSGVNQCSGTMAETMTENMNIIITDSSKIGPIRTLRDCHGLMIVSSESEPSPTDV